MFKRNVLLFACIFGLNAIDVRAAIDESKVCFFLGAAAVCVGIFKVMADTYDKETYGTGEERVKTMQGLQKVKERKCAYNRYNELQSKADRTGDSLDTEKAEEAFARYQEVLKMTSNPTLS